MGARGDSTAEGAEGPIYAPYALPGEQVGRGSQAGGPNWSRCCAPARAPSRQFAGISAAAAAANCSIGGIEPYLDWKREQVVDALSKRGFGGAFVEPTIAAWGEGRRRAAFHAARQNNQVRIGFIERGGAR
jgi:23S rRNA (uracil1939-C5)-methyltransferase